MVRRIQHPKYFSGSNTRESHFLENPESEAIRGPFGMNIAGLGLDYESGNRYLYNGKEKQSEHNLDWLDYGARMYDAQIGRWHSVDPASEMYLQFSPFNYTLNNPVRLIDPNGMWVEEGDRFSTNNPDEIWAFIQQFQGKGNKDKIYDGGTLDEVVVTASRLEGDEGGSGIGDFKRGGSFGLNFNATPGGGFNFEFGFVWDGSGDWSLYSSFGPSVGLDASLGVTYKKIEAMPGETFAIKNYEGYGGSDNVGFLSFDFVMKGGNNKSNTFPSQYGKTYKESGIGISIGSPVGYSREFNKTSLIKGPSFQKLIPSLLKKPQ